jgi:hypothetical protein
MVAVSCTQKGGGEYGYLTISVSDEIDADITVKSDAEGEGDGSEDGDDPQQEVVYSIKVVDSEGNVDAEVADHRTITEASPVPLLMGKYDVIASSGEEGSGFNSPRWGGENNVRIWAAQPASVDITCKMKKVMFSVSFPEDDEFQSKFPSYSLSVRAGEEEDADILVFSNNPQSGEGSFSDIAYFEVPSDRKIVYTLYMTNADGAQYSSTGKVEQVSSAEHYHFEFTLGEKEEIDGALVMNITLDGEYKETVVHQMNLNFDKTLMPSYTTNSEFDPDAEGIVYPLGNDIPKRFSFSAPRGIKSLIIAHLDHNLLQEGLPQVTDFVGITPENNAVLQGLGIDCTIADGALTADIDITDFVKNLHISPDNEPYMMSLVVVDKYDRYARCDFQFTIVSDIQAETGSVFPWSSWAVLKGRYFAKTPPAGMTFQYKKADASDWVEIDPSLVKIDQQTMTYSYMLNHLDLNSNYLFRSTSDKDKADGKVAAEVPFSTIGSQNTIYNMSFDDWTKVDDVMYPASSLDEAHYVWDTANKAAKIVSKTPTDKESGIVISGNAAKLKSVTAFGVLAAGNIYTGKFGNVEGVGAILKWGHRFDSRPLAMRGWYRYEPANINIASDNYSHLKGQPDFCQIQIFLAKWASQFEINTTTGKFVDISNNNSTIIAHGQIVTQDNTTDNPGNRNGYVQFTIPLEYRSLEQPTYVVISGAASRYGDYFTGGEGSTLYLDEFELIYDPEQLTDAEFEVVFGRVR